MPAQDNTTENEYDKYGPYIPGHTNIKGSDFMSYVGIEEQVLDIARAKSMMQDITEIRDNLKKALNPASQIGPIIKTRFETQLKITESALEFITSHVEQQKDKDEPQTLCRRDMNEHMFITVGEISGEKISPEDYHLYTFFNRKIPSVLSAPQQKNSAEAITYINQLFTYHMPKSTNILHGSATPVMVPAKFESNPNGISLETAQELIDDVNFMAISRLISLGQHASEEKLHNMRKSPGYLVPNSAKIFLGKYINDNIGKKPAPQLFWEDINSHLLKTCKEITGREFSGEEIFHIATAPRNGGIKGLIHTTEETRTTEQECADAWLSIYHQFTALTKAYKGQFTVNVKE